VMVEWPFGSQNLNQGTEERYFKLSIAYGGLGRCVFVSYRGGRLDGGDVVTFALH
jgi:hypothetical protein